MTAYAGPQPTIPFHRGPSRTTAIAEAVIRRLRALAAAWWYVPLAQTSRATARTASRLHGRFKAWRALQRTRNALLELDERTLRDIGLERHDIRRLTRSDLRRRDGSRWGLSDPLSAIHRWHL